MIVGAAPRRRAGGEGCNNADWVEEVALFSTQLVYIHASAFGHPGLTNFRFSRESFIGPNFIDDPVYSI
jgi:hypothetical protein